MLQVVPEIVRHEKKRDVDTIAVRCCNHLHYSSHKAFFVVVSLGVSVLNDVHMIITTLKPLTSDLPFNHHCRSNCRDIDSVKGKVQKQPTWNIPQAVRLLRACFR